MKPKLSQPRASSIAAAARALTLLAIGTMVANAQEPQSTFQVHPSLTVELFAREPDVLDPVALTFDERGRMYVVEMRDYPYGIGPDLKPGGTIRLLEDQNHDGRADRSTLFAEGLSFPTSIAPWQGGVFVAAPPEILYLKDTDGDGKADVREVAYRGFALGVTDSNMNGLRWNLDNRIHGSNGGNGGTVTSPRQPGVSVPLRNLDFSFDPRSGELGTTYQTSAGFGLVFDDWGRSFCTYNINHIQHRSLAARYLERFPGFPPIATTFSISDHGDMARIYPISAPETRVNHPEQSGHFSSAGGMGYLGTRFPIEALRNSVLICDVVGNLVHRDRIIANGAGFVASRPAEEMTREFLASREPAFRPVGVELGLDGALYLIDMQRDVIEHPDYIPDKVKRKLDIRAGDNRGRIYRLVLVPRERISTSDAAMDKLTAAELAQELSHWNQTRRLTAQRLILERRDRNVIPTLLEMVVREPEPVGRVHAMWALDALEALQPAVLLAPLSDTHPGVRENALVLSEKHVRNSTRLRDRILSLSGDADPRVRFQAALTLGELDMPAAREALLKILETDWLSRQTRWAVMSSLRTSADITAAIRHLVQTSAFRGAQVPEQDACIQELADLAVARSGGSAEPEVLRLLELVGRSEYPEHFRAAALSGVDSGLARLTTISVNRVRAAESLQPFFSSERLPVVRAAWRVARRLELPESERQRDLLQSATRRALDNARPLAERLENTALLELGQFSSVGAALFSLLDVLQPQPLQQASLEVLARFNDPEIAKRLIAAWKNLSPALRPKVIDLLLQRVSYHSFLVEAMETGAIKVGELNLDLEQRRRLLRDSARDVQARAAKLIGDEEYSNRKQVVEEWLEKLPAHGDAARGRVLFEQHCAQCHVMDGLGHNVGPNLAALAHRSVEDLASNILDPNMAIPPSYVSYHVELKDGELQTGILQAQTPDAITLLQPLGKQLVLARSSIKRIESSGLSLMPEGLETSITPQDLRDLIAFLQRPVK